MAEITSTKEQVADRTKRNTKLRTTSTKTEPMKNKIAHHMISIPSGSHNCNALALQTHSGSASTEKAAGSYQSWLVQKPICALVQQMNPISTKSSSERLHGILHQSCNLLSTSIDNLLFPAGKMCFCFCVPD